MSYFYYESLSKKLIIPLQLNSFELKKQLKTRQHYTGTLIFTQMFSKKTCVTFIL